MLFLEDRIIIPQSMKKEMLELLHESHLGISKSKVRARKVMYWPGINIQIENYINRCTICQMNQDNNTKEVLVPRKIPWLPNSGYQIHLLIK